MDYLLLFEIVGIVIALIAFMVALYFYLWVKKLPKGTADMEHIGMMIKKGARAFLRREYRTLAWFVLAASVLIFVFLPNPVWKSANILDNVAMVIAYIAGSVFSALAGKIGIEVATIANVKAAVAAKTGIRKAFSAGFRGGAVMGMAVVGAALIGASLLLLIVPGNTSAVLGFSFGASTLALFAKAGGGIFTKTADISADLVGKVELGLEEDDPRNPAVIADNVGDNVGDVAGMGADLFDSNVAAIAAAVIIGSTLTGGSKVDMVLCYAGLGLLASILGVLFARMGKSEDPGKALNKSTYITTALYAVLTAGASLLFKYDFRIWGATVVGLFVGVIIGLATDYFTNDAKKPVRHVAKSSQSGPAFTILSGISYGFMSALPALLGIGVSAAAAYFLCYPLGTDAASCTQYAMFGISMAALGMLSIVGMIVSNDAYGPIVDNSRGLAEMGGLGEDVIKITDELDSAGNTVKAITKGFAIGAAGLTVIALLAAFMEVAEAAAASNGLDFAQFTGFDIMNPLVFFGLLAGLGIPALFSALLIMGVDRNAQRMVAEIHRQFDEIPGLREGKPGVVPEYEKCIDIAAKGALKELVPAGLMAILVTLVVGFAGALIGKAFGSTDFGGIYALGGFLAGNIVSGLLLALFMSNAGGTWDNAKKYVEAGNFGGKGSTAHKAAVTGDTVGDPFKDTAGPSLNTQITVVSLVANLTAGLFIVISMVL